MPRNAADYHGDNGLLYCGKCQTPKEAFFPKGLVLMGKNKHPAECSCQRTEREQQEALINQQKHINLVRRLKAEGFSDPAMLDWTFENDNGRPCAQRTLGCFSGAVLAPARVSLPDALRTL